MLLISITLYIVGSNGLCLTDCFAGGHPDMISGGSVNFCLKESLIKVGSHTAFM